MSTDQIVPKWSFGEKGSKVPFYRISGLLLLKSCVPCQNPKIGKIGIFRKKGPNQRGAEWRDEGSETKNAKKGPKSRHQR